MPTIVSILTNIVLNIKCMGQISCASLPYFAARFRIFKPILFYRSKVIQNTCILNISKIRTNAKSNLPNEHEYAMFMVVLYLDMS